MFWKSLAHFILKFRVSILFILTVLTLVMGYFATQVKMRYDMASAIPEDNPEYIKYEKFLKTFGQDGNMMVVGFDKENVFEPNFFKSFSDWQEKIKTVDGVVGILSIPSAIQIKKAETDSTSKLISELIFHKGVNMDSAAIQFKNLPFYSGLLYNPMTHANLNAIYLDGEKIRTKNRVQIINHIKEISAEFAQKNQIEIHYSGLPYIRTEFAESLRAEMNLILIASLVLTSLILLLFFRSFTAMLFSMIVVFAGVVWAVSFIELAGYKITILTALIAPLIVVIGIPNCIYFLNKYHTQFALTNNKREALISMVDRMGIVTLFTNLTAAIGFGVFYFTKSQVLKEFGFVAGLSILVVFVISLLSIPAIFSFLPAPKTRHTKYLENKYLTSVLLKFEYWVTHNRRAVYALTLIAVVVSVIGILRLKSVGHIVDDLPKENTLYSDLKYFEKNFHGVMPLEIMIDTKKKNGASSLNSINKVNEFTQSLKSFSEFSKPLSFVEAIKFARQAFYDGDSSSFDVPNSFDISFLLPYLKVKSDSGKSQYSSLATSFLDSNKQIIRVSVGIEDVGSIRLPSMLDSVSKMANTIFDSTKYDITYTGTSVVFLEGS
ncbi:MAG: MMPL family transporter, partial [Chitinophagaceae bacterium]|nr:MMPL family transporter [Chitinophagaceae bacterium]